MNSYRIKVAFVLLCIIAAIAFPGKALGEALAVSTATITPPSAPLPESPDFATRVLRDPWDMSQFTDISQLLNNGGQTDLLRKISVANGLFNAISSPRGDAQFYPLIPGYPLSLPAGKVGNIYPIPKSTYKCLYIAMQVNSTYSWDGFQVFWFANEKYANPAGTYGVTTLIPLFPEANGAQPTPGWRLYSVNLSTAASTHTPWDNMPAIRGLRIDPSAGKSTGFSVDWIRLTDCNSVQAALTWTGGTAANTSIWLQPAGTGRNIRVVTGVDGLSGAYTLDTQGLMPGSYYVGLGTATTCDATCTSQMNTSAPLVINQAPIATFSRPSFTSGSGKSWDFNDKSDVFALRNFKSTAFVGGNLRMVTASSHTPDPQVYLTTPTTPATQIHTNAYQYLTFRMSSTNGKAPWQDPVEGMIARWIWTVKGPNKGTCWLVTQGVPYDVGYNTYTIDLYNSVSGKAVTRFGDCAGLSTWLNSGAITQLRFDPNENITCRAVRKPYVLQTCGNYVQNLDYIRLTAMDQVTLGSVFPVEITLNRSLDNPSSLTFYYTTALSDPTQAPAAGAILTTGTDVTYNWDTTGVPAGTYFICVKADDGINPVTSCSEANVAVVAPTP